MHVDQGGARRRWPGARAAAVERKTPGDHTGSRQAWQRAGGQRQPRPAGREPDQPRPRTGENVTYPFSGGHRWGSPADARAARGRNPADPATTPDTGSLGRGGCREGRHVATINAPLPGVSDSCGHIDAPMFLRRALKDLALAARKLELTEAGGRRHAKALVRVQRLHGRVAARRATWQQHLADRPRSAMRKERAAAPVGRH